MSISLLPLCSTPKIADRDGGTGPLARLLLPFYHVSTLYTYWFASGQQYTFPSGTAPQNRSMSLQGTTKPNTFVKTPGVCIGG